MLLSICLVCLYSKRYYNIFIVLERFLLSWPKAEKNCVVYRVRVCVCVCIDVFQINISKLCV